MPFKRRVIKNYQNIWAFTRSSKFLYKKMVKNIDFSRDIQIIEFWAWDWIFTDELIKQTSKNSKIFIFEIDEGFCKILKEKYKNEPKVIIYEKSASCAEELFKNNSIDYILSSLPLAFINTKNITQILNGAKKILKPNGDFIQFQYFLQNKKDIKNTFKKIDYTFTFLNFPPAFIYICHK